MYRATTILFALAVAASSRGTNLEGPQPQTPANSAGVPMATLVPAVEISPVNKKGTVVPFSGKGPYVDIVGLEKKLELPAIKKDDEDQSPADGTNPQSTNSRARARVSTSKALPTETREPNPSALLSRRPGRHAEPLIYAIQRVPRCVWACMAGATRVFETAGGKQKDNADDLNSICIHDVHLLWHEGHSRLASCVARLGECEYEDAMRTIIHACRVLEDEHRLGPAKDEKLLQAGQDLVTARISTIDKCALEYIPEICAGTRASVASIWAIAAATVAAVGVVGLW